MNFETQKEHPEEGDIPVRLTRRGKAVLAVAGAGLSVFGAHEVVASQQPHFEGTKQVTIHENTVTGIAHDEVAGSENHIGATVDKIVEMNPDVFQDKKAFVESEDMGKTIEVPKSVD